MMREERVTYTTHERVFGHSRHHLIEEKEKLMEKRYKRTEHKALGQALTHGHVLPEFTEDSEFRFGVATDKCDVDVHSIINPGYVTEDEQVHKMYIKSHNMYAPGEQLDRNYDWKYASKDTVFGVLQKAQADGSQVRDAMFWTEERRKLDGAKIVENSVAAIRRRKVHELGKVHDPIADTMKVPADHTFGLSLSKDSLTAGQLIGYRAEEQVGGKHDNLTDKINRCPFEMPDESATTYGISTKDAHKASVPSRMDLELMSDDLNANALLFPNPYELYGEEFQACVQKHLSKKTEKHVSEP